MPFLQRLLGALIGVALLVAAFFFVSLLLAVAAAAALLLWGWLWWRTRNLPREQHRSPGEVIEGEYRIEREIGRDSDDAR